MNHQVKVGSRLPACRIDMTHSSSSIIMGTPIGFSRERNNEIRRWFGTEIGANGLAPRQRPVVYGWPVPDDFRFAQHVIT